MLDNPKPVVAFPCGSRSITRIFFPLIERPAARLITVVVFTFLSNFIDIKFYEVDQVDSASEITLNLSVTEGFFVEDYKLRNLRGVDKEFNYSNSQSTLFDAWKNGCPN